MTKEYKANTNMSINVVLANKKNMHISFVPFSDGSSVFKTDNPDIQKAIENHYNFGKSFRLVREASVAQECDKKENAETTDVANKNEFQKVAVSDIASAKDYLADTFGISRTSLRKTESVLKKAEELGIEFVGL